MTVHAILAKPLVDLTAADIHALKGASEAEDLEFNGPLPWKDKASPEPWAAGRKHLAEYTRNEIVKEVVGLANAGGGTFFLGVDDDGTGVAADPRPLPDAQALAERLRQVFDSMIDPRLPDVQVEAIEMTPGMGGVIAIRVAQSWLRPHKHAGYGHCFARRGSRAEPMSMREVRDMIYLGDRGMADIDRRFRERSAEVFDRPRMAPRPTFGCRFTAQPLTPISTGRLSRKWMNALPLDGGRARRSNGTQQELGPQFDIGRPRPVVRAWTAGGVADGDATYIRIEERGFIDLTWVTSCDPEATEETIYAGWLIGQLRCALCTIDEVRKIGNAPAAQFVLEIETIMAVPGVYRLAEMGVDPRAPTQPLRPELFPRYQVGRCHEFNALANAFYVDLLDSAGIEHAGLPFTIDGFPAA